MDATLSLAISLTNTKGATALLLGSGISSAAGVLTGWGITLDLVQKVAAAMNEKPGPDPAAWYKDKFGEDPDYSKLLEQLAPTKTERQRLLRGYFEPTEEEQEEGLKQPTKAHHAIAELVKKGYVRVILTTNFDQLLEKALEAVGVHPAVISDAGAIESMVPLQHEPVTIIKLHGHYLTTRLRNTPSELETYEPELNELLSRVLNEYGLIICGWSGVWDAALREGMLKSRAHLFSTYWTIRGPLAAEAKPLAEHRGAKVISIAGADEFFQKLTEKVVALEDLSQPLPVTTAVAVATLKRYLPVEAHRIRLHDLVMAEVETVWEVIFDKIPGGQPDEASITATVHAMDSVCGRLLNLLAVGSYWGTAVHRTLWLRAVERLSQYDEDKVRTSNYSVWLSLTNYPLMLCFYSVGLGAIASNNLDMLMDLILKPKLSVSGRNDFEAPAKRLMRGIDQDYLGPLWPGPAKRKMPLNDHLHRVLRPVFAELIPSEIEYDNLFDRFEYLLALAFNGVLQQLKDSDAGYFYNGRFLYRSGWSGGNLAVKAVKQEIEDMGLEWPMLQRGLFGGLATELGQAVAKLDERIGKARFW